MRRVTRFVMAFLIAAVLGPFGLSGSVGWTPVSAQTEASDEIDPTRLALSIELIELTQAEQLSNTMIEAIVPLQMQQLRQNRPDLTAEQFTIIDEILRDELAMMMENMMPKIAVAYAEVFTENELGEMVDFYKTETGKRFIEETPGLMQKGMMLGMEAAQEAMPRLGERLKERLAERGIDL